MKSKAEVVIIGGGSTGTSIAYHLAKMGVKDVVLLEKSYLGSGSTFRCASGIRAQFTDEANIKLQKYNIERWKKLSEELEYEINFKQTGYLFLATSEEEVETFRNNIRLQNRFGVPTRLITPEEAKEIVPPLNTDFVLAGAWNPTDGKACPFKAVFAFARKAREMGVEIYEYTPVTGIIVENGEIRGVKTEKGVIKTNIIVNAANAWAPIINEMAGLNRQLIPIKPYKHQLIKTEPIEPGQIEPLVCPPAYNDSYVIQDGEDGGVLCGTGLEYGPTYDMNPTYEFLREVLKWATTIIPALKYVHVIRQWAGFYAKTPDSNPAIGKIDYIDGFYIAAGFSGHGFMMAPGVGDAMAELIVKGRVTRVPLDLEWYDPHRFERGELRSTAFQIG